MSETTQAAAAIPFKAETRQILDILIHSLYTEREIFLRELISNASDALTRLEFEMLTNREVLDAEAEPGIWLSADPEQRTLTLRDNGIGMTAEELTRNLGTIAHSGARAFLQAAGSMAQSQEEGEAPKARLSDIIGQFGVGFYSVFMVAEQVRVTSRSYRLEDQAAVWTCDGGDTFTVEPAEKSDRGTVIEIKLKEDAAEFAQQHRLSEIIRRHSDFVPYPIHLGSEGEQANHRTALWRQSPRQVEKKDYHEFYRQLTLDFEEPLSYTHVAADAPVQVYALLYLPSRPERSMFSPRKQDGLKLYARKVLIQEYSKDLLPEYLGFLQGVVDSEDLPLNVSRESVQSNRLMGQLKKLVTSKAMDMLKKLASDEPETYAKFWAAGGRMLKQGVAIEQNNPEALHPLLRFHTTAHPGEWRSLEEYVAAMLPGQTHIYYILGDDDRSAMVSPHLDAVRKYGYEVLLMTDPLDAFMLTRLRDFDGKPLANVAQADLKLPEKSGETPEAAEPAVPAEDWVALIERFKVQLGERVEGVRMTDRLHESPARLVDPEGAAGSEMQRVYKLLHEDFVAPKKVLELNPRHPILHKLNALSAEDERSVMAIDQLYENALLIEGLLPDPASMIGRIHKLIEKAL